MKKIFLVIVASFLFNNFAFSESITERSLVSILILGLPKLLFYSILAGVIGGGVCDLVPAVREQYLKTAEQAYHEFALDGFKNIGRFEFSVCGDESPVIGSLAHAYLNAANRRT